MNRRLLMVFIFAILVALATSAGIYYLLAGRIAASANASLSQILVAARDLPIGTVIREADLKQVRWGGELPKGAVTAKAELLQRSVIEIIDTGAIVTESHLAPKGGGAGLAAKIPAGKRAVAVRVNDVVGLAGFVLPGMKVDVIVLGDPPGKGRENLGAQAHTLLQNVAVLSAGQNIQRDVEGKPVTVQVVNLLVTPEEAELLSLAGSEARIQLVLRNPLDQDIVKTPGTAQSHLYSTELAVKPLPSGEKSVSLSRPVPPKPKPPVIQHVVVPITMEVIQGAKRADVKVGENVEERVQEEKKK